jgi:hypothetical protein
METPKIVRIYFGNKLDFTNFPTLIFPSMQKELKITQVEVDFWDSFSTNYEFWKFYYLAF